MFVLYSQNYAATALSILFKTPKTLLLKSSYPKKYLPNFCTQKNPGIENFKPRKILRSSRHLKFRVPPPGPRTSKTIPYSAASTYIAHIWEYPPPRGFTCQSAVCVCCTPEHTPQPRPQGMRLQRPFKRSRFTVTQ